MALENIIHLALLGSFFSPLIALFVLASITIYWRSLSEQVIARIVQGSFLSYLLCATVSSLLWLFFGLKPIKWELVLFHIHNYHPISLSLYLDAAGAVLLFTTAVIANVIVFYSRRYLHRDPGYPRFFTCLSLFILGMTIILCAGTFNLIFAGWEMVGFSSYLLIGYYWHRPKAIVNSNQAYLIYRICDLGLLASALMSHLIWDTHDLFYELSTGSLLQGFIHAPLWQQWMLSLVILLPVIGKSAQFPVSYWLPKAMEGPTPSSAIFYGSLSIHAGVFLLIRTFSIWYNTPGFVWVLGGIGFLTSLFSGLFCRTQATIKGQIGYASITQVGIMLIELALGFPMLALFHLVGNAFLRCYQLLISPSILTQQLRIHSALEGEVLLNQWAIENFLPKKLESTLYVFSLNEGYFEPLLKKYLAKPVQDLANTINKLHTKMVSFVLWPRKNRPLEVQNHLSMHTIAVIPLIALGISLIGTLGENKESLQPTILLFSALFALSSLGEWQNSKRLINSAVLSNALAATALWIDVIPYERGVFLYLIGLLASYFIALDAILYISKKRRLRSLNTYYGYFGQFPLASGVCLVGILGIIGFPIAATFLGEDILLRYAFEQGWLFVLVFNMIFVINGFSLIRMFSRVFWGKADNYALEIPLDFSKTQTSLRLACFLLGNFLAVYLNNALALFA